MWIFPLRFTMEIYPSPSSDDATQDGVVINPWLPFVNRCQWGLVCFLKVPFTPCESENDQFTPDEIENPKRSIENNDKR